eukprot:CAMPEP_0175554032 /NCGR_PEP_ID=MMETSP0096-20121207/33650_1 /TAXON_ID=311494 /ORGANISM="Alexandrium monilatum, Strain CCMP3105" /LENGTH=287 /DNA_ID=CAMNT_0016857137 /DNA_START=309 /DNA_END=1168 /DNA_ORIENTATION=-
MEADVENKRIDAHHGDHVTVEAEPRVVEVAVPPVDLLAEAGEQDPERNRQHPLCAVVNGPAGVAEAWHATEYAPVIVEVNVDVGPDESAPCPGVVASGHEEDEHRKDEVDQDVGVSAGVHDHPSRHGPLCPGSHNAHVGAKDELLKMVGTNNEAEFPNVAPKEGDRPAVLEELLAQGLLYREGLVDVLHAGEILYELSPIGVRVVRFHHSVGHDGRDEHVQNHANRHGDGVEDHVGRLAVILEVVADALRDHAAHEEEELVADEDHDHHDVAGRSRGYGLLVREGVG